MVGESREAIPETRFGTWFQGTGLWRRYVLLEALAELERLLGSPSSRFARVLDVGCGRGLALPFLAERLRLDRLIGIDSDARLLRRASTCHVGGAPLELHHGDVTRLELPDASVDLAFCHQTLHHVGDQERALAELHRVLAPGGVLLLAESCRPFIELPWVRLLFRHDMEKQRTAEEYLALLRRAGFAFGEAAVATPDPWWSRRDLGRSGRSLDRTAHTLVCVAATKRTQQ